MWEKTKSEALVKEVTVCLWKNSPCGKTQLILFFFFFFALCFDRVCRESAQTLWRQASWLKFLYS